MFGWHKEDMDLYSINYLHEGQPKFWYSVNLELRVEFEKSVSLPFHSSFTNCSAFRRPKKTLIHPDNLIPQGVSLLMAF